jgi:hypothetical protein
MARVWSMTLGVFAVLFLLVVAAAPAAAQQNTINQTTCGGVSGFGSCLTNGFLQDLAVDCTVAGAAGQIGTALAQITDRAGPNRITVSGTCNAGFNIQGFDRLTIKGNNATITKGVNIIDSRNVLLQSITFDFATAPGNFLGINGGQAQLDGVTVKNGSGNSGIGIVQGGLGFTGSPSLITSNACAGIDVGAGGLLNLLNVTVSNNGSGQNCGSQNHGVKVHNGGSVNISNLVGVNGVATDAPVDISGNMGAGIDAEGPSTVTTSLGSPTAAVHIHGNGGPAVALFGGAAADLEGHLQFDGNAPDGFLGFPTAQAVAFSNAALFMGGGAQVTGGVSALLNSFAGVGSDGPMSITGGVSLLYGSAGFMSAANTIDTLSCDQGSFMVTDGATVFGGGKNTCPNNAPAKGDKGDTGAQGIQGIQGPPGPVTTTGSVFTAAGSNGFLASFSGASNLGNSPIFTQAGLTGVGATSPQNPPADMLHIRFTNTAGSMTGLAVQNLGNTSSSYSGMLFYDQNGALGQFQGFNNVTHEYRINNIASGGSINFMLGTSKFFVGSTGIGIGTTTPATALQVSGNVRVGTSGTNGCVQAFDGSPIGGTCSSDLRLKQNIEPFGPVLEKVTQLNPVSYEWRRDEHPEYQFGEGRMSGLIAQEVEQVFPSMVGQDGNGYKAVNYSQLPLLLLQAVRELKAENDTLRSTLEEQRREFQAQLDALKKRKK